MTRDRFARTRRTLAIAEKEIRHVLRDVRTLYIALAMPFVMLLLFGFGVSFDLDHLRVAFVDHAHSHASRALAERILADDLFDDAGPLADVAAAERALVSGEILAAVVIDRDFEEERARGRTPPIQVLLDGSDNTSAVQAQNKLEAAISSALTHDRDQRGTSPGPRVEVRTFTRFNPAGKSAVFLVPGIAAYMLSIVAVLLTALTVAREWESGSMMQLFATPATRLEIVLGKLLPYLALGGLAVLVVLAAGTRVFDVPFRGSGWALTALSLLFLIGMLGQGLLISVLTRNQMVATQVATMSSMLPSMLLSGFVFPVENMPTLLQWVSRLVPARYYVAGLRGVLLRGNGFGDVAAELFLLALFALVVLAVATARFPRSLS